MSYLLERLRNPITATDDMIEAADRIEALEAALRKIAGHDEYSIEDHEAAAHYKSEKGIWTTDEYLADAALAPEQDR